MDWKFVIHFTNWIEKIVITSFQSYAHCEAKEKHFANAFSNHMPYLVNTSSCEHLTMKTSTLNTSNPRNLRGLCGCIFIHEIIYMDPTWIISTTWNLHRHFEPKVFRFIEEARTLSTRRHTIWQNLKLLIKEKGSIKAIITIILSVNGENIVKTK